MHALKNINNSVYKIRENESLKILENPLDALLSMSSPSSSSKLMASNEGSLLRMRVYARFGRGPSSNKMSWGLRKIRENWAGDLSILENDFGLLRIREKDDDPPPPRPDLKILENDPGFALRILEKRGCWGTEDPWKRGTPQYSVVSILFFAPWSQYSWETSSLVLINCIVTSNHMFDFDIVFINRTGWCERIYKNKDHQKQTNASCNIWKRCIHILLTTVENIILIL